MCCSSSILGRMLRILICIQFNILLFLEVLRSLWDKLFTLYDATSVHEDDDKFKFDTSEPT